MIKAIQLDLFSDSNEISVLRQEIEMYRDSANKVRKSVHAKLDAHLKLICALQDEVASLKQLLAQSEPQSRTVSISADRIAM